MPKIVVNQVQLHYAQAGQGPDLVMIHGLAASISFWYLRIVPLLADHFRVTVYDLRGHGLSQSPPSGYSTAGMASDLGELLAALGMRTAHLMGHSFGGAVALQYATLHPERVRTLSLVDCRVNCLQPIADLHDHAYWRQRRQELKESGIDVAEDTPRVVYCMLEELTALAVAAKSDASPVSGLMASGGIWNRNSRAAQRWTRLVQSTSFAQDFQAVAGLTRERIAGLSVPTLLSYGGSSNCLPTCRELEALVPDHRTTIHAELGHFFPLVAPHLVVEDFLAFLAGLSTRDAAAAALAPHIAPRG